MKKINPKGFIPIIIVAFVAAIALAMVGVAIYYKLEKNKQAKETINTNQVAVNTNTVINTNTSLNTNSVTNTNVAVDVTAGWQTYTDTKYGFTIKYPAQWKTESVKGTTLLSLYKESTDSNNHYPDPNKPLDGIITVSIMQNPDNKTLQQLFDQHYYCDPNNEEGCPGPPDVSKMETVIIDGIESLKSNRGPILPEEPAIYIPQEGYYLVIGGAKYNYVGNYDFNADFNAILSTFKFTDQTADWKTYTSTEYGYSLKHPKEWKEKLASSDGVFDFYIDVVPTNPGESSTAPKVTIIPFTIGTGETLELAYKRVTGSDVSSLQSEAITVGGIQGRYYVGIPSFLSYDAALVQNGTSGYEIRNDTTREIFDLVLSTFQFTQ